MFFVFGWATQARLLRIHSSNPEISSHGCAKILAEIIHSPDETWLSLSAPIRLRLIRLLVITIAVMPEQH